MHKNPPPFLLLVLVAGCSRAPAEQTTSTPPPAAAASQPPATVAPAATRPEGLALQWDDPTRWKKKKPSTSMRAAEYAVPHATNDTEDGECIVITFGPGQGGSVDQNIDRWVAQFAGASDKSRTTHEAHGMKVTRVETSGTYTPMVMPGAPTGQAAQPGSRLIGAIVEARSGPWFFKMTGRDATIKAAAGEFDAMVDSSREK
jgi:hypothetical protein